MNYSIVSLTLKQENWSYYSLNLLSVIDLRSMENNIPSKVELLWLREIIQMRDNGKILTAAG